MDLRTLTKLVLKLLGLYWLTASLVGAVNLGALMLSGLGHDTTPYRMFNLIGYFVVGAALLWFPGTIANRVLRIEGAESEGGITANRLLAVGTSLLGLYLTITSISALVFSIGSFASTDERYASEQVWAFVAWLVQLGIGLTLIFARPRIVSIMASADDR